MFLLSLVCILHSLFLHLNNYDAFIDQMYKEMKKIQETGL